MATSSLLRKPYAAPDAVQALLQFDRVRKSFPAGSSRRVILDDVSFDVAAGSVTTLFGPNGCGKSTLMNILSGLDTADSGVIHGIEAVRGNLGFVFQDYRRSLLPWGNVQDNILFPLKLRRVSKAEQLQRLEALLALTDVHLDMKQRVTGLSGGQAQMVCILRALIIEPKLLVLDEPFSALDYEKTIFLRQKLLDIAGKLSLTMLFISHDIDEALYLGDQVVFLTKSPTTIAEVLPVTLPSPRVTDVLASHDFAELKLKALHIFERCADTREL